LQKKAERDLMLFVALRQQQANSTKIVF